MQVAIRRIKNTTLKEGDTDWRYCPACWVRTWHVWTGHEFMCLECIKEQEKRKEAACLNQVSGG